MRLLRAIGRLEGAAAAAEEERAEACAIGVLWTDVEARVEARSLEPGEMIAADVYLVRAYADQEFPDLTAESDPASRCGTHEAVLRERVTRDAEDLGWVYRGAPGPDARICGRVVESDGGMLTFCECEPPV